MSRNVLLLFKRDLRVADNPALALAAVRGDGVLPLYVVEPAYWALPDTSARQWRFTAECLQGLHDDLAALGAPLIVRVGEMETVLADLCRAHAITEIVSTEETGNLWTYARDRRVAAWARDAGIAWQEVPQQGVQRRLPARDGWAAARERVIRQPVVPVPAGLRGVSVASGAIPDARDLGLAFDPCPGRQKGGGNAAAETLASFLSVRGQDYRRAMSSPQAGAIACSRLSPFLAMGVVSPRIAAQAAAARKLEVQGARDGWAGAMNSFAARLAWRDHFMQKLEDAPAIETRCLHAAYEGMRPRVPDAALLAAWQVGETGLPFVDACMRSLNATGWLNFRMRAMLMAVASYHLWLDWRSTGPHLARMFTDYEPGIHWPQVQMQSGTTGMNTMRIYNPVKQGHDQDPTGVFVRRWCPELRTVPDAFVQEPWRWEGAGRVLGKAYPAPVVDVARAARAARERVWAVRGGDGFGTEAARIVAKHASRKTGPGGHRFVNDRAPGGTRGRRDTGQLYLDL